MVRAKDKATPTKPGRAVANWQAEMAEQAKLAVEQEKTAGSGGGRFFGLRAGQLTFDDGTFPGNQIAVVIVDHVFENIYYEGEFDPESKNPPTCFAFGRDATTMGPPPEVDEHDEFTRQSAICADCIQNEWGSAERGKGKACSNRRRLALIPAGTYIPQGKSGGFELELEDDASHFAKADVAYLKVPVMSVKGFASYVKQVAEQFNRPLHGVVTRIYVEPDPKSQFRVKFEAIDMVEDELMPAIMSRHNHVRDEIEFPYIPRSDDDEDQPTQRSASSNRKLKKGNKPVKRVK
jgi:hypothetical protein